jgi:hypothetical protein
MIFCIKNIPGLPKYRASKEFSVSGKILSFTNAQNAVQIKTYFGQE